MLTKIFQCLLILFLEGVSVDNIVWKIIVWHIWKH